MITLTAAMDPRFGGLDATYDGKEGLVHQTVDGHYRKVKVGKWCRALVIATTVPAIVPEGMSDEAHAASTEFELTVRSETLVTIIKAAYVAAYVKGEVYEGEDIPLWYERLREVGIKSCMRGEDLGLYVMNPDTISMLVFKLHDAPIGRTIVWSVDGQVFHGGVYTVGSCNSPEQQGIRAWLHDKGYGDLDYDREFEVELKWEDDTTFPYLDGSLTCDRPKNGTIIIGTDRELECQRTCGLAPWMFVCDMCKGTYDVCEAHTLDDDGESVVCSECLGEYVQCQTCGDYVTEDNAIEVHTGSGRHSHWLCRRHAEDLSTCHSCGDVFECDMTVIGDNEYCPRCARNT